MFKKKSTAETKSQIRLLTILQITFASHKYSMQHMYMKITAFVFFKYHNTFTL